jgi:hypothetical protein
MFHRFYEVVRIGIQCRDNSKIPTSRLFELYVIFFQIKVEDLQAPFQMMGSWQWFKLSNNDQHEKDQQDKNDNMETNRQMW